MASGPLVFIHPVIEKESTTAHPPGSIVKSNAGMVLRHVDDDYFFWNASTTANTTAAATTSNAVKPQATASSTWDLSTDHLLPTDWLNSPRGHSDPNLQ